MEAHVDSVYRSSFFYLHNMSSIRRVLDMKTTVIIVQALVISRLDYCNSLLCGLPAIFIKRLQRVQNAAARVIAKADRRDTELLVPYTNGCEVVYRKQCIVVYSIAIVVFNARYEFINRGKLIIFSFKPNQPHQINRCIKWPHILATHMQT